MVGEPHIVKSYDEQLGRLRDAVASMGGLGEKQLAAALKALAERDGELAAQVVAADAEVDAGEAFVNEQAVRLLVLRAPVADDLRVVFTALKISADLERIADLAGNIAKRTGVLTQLAPVAPVASVGRMGRLVAELLHAVLDAYMGQDADAAMAVRDRDQEVDDLYSSLFREILTHMMEDPRTITACIHLLFIAKNIERIGDHATNIAEMCHYLVTGRNPKGERPKRDDSPFVGAP
ncbi:MAG: phosphate signaling complex protein PhoU [Actinomycetota bacterium]